MPDWTVLTENFQNVDKLKAISVLRDPFGQFCHEQMLCKLMPRFNFFCEYLLPAGVFTVLNINTADY